MSGARLFTLAVAAAVGLHLGGFALWGGARTGGAEAAGAGGADLVTLAARSASVAALVAQWERPPEVAAAPAPPKIAPPETPPAPSATPDTRPHIRPPVAALPDVAPMTPPKPSEPAKPQPEKTAPKPAKPSVAVPKQLAKGQGGAQSSGAKGAAEAGTSKAQAKALWAEWGAQIRARIERKKRYPTGAGGAQGKVTVQLRVARSGSLQSVGVARSSGSAALDRAAVQAVKAAGTFPAAPKSLGEAAYTFNLSISFKR